jgi:hypothetical protein
MEYKETDFAIRLHDGRDEPCGICNGPIYPDVVGVQGVGGDLRFGEEPYTAGPFRGPELFLIETWSLVCEDCGWKYAPELAHARFAYYADKGEEAGGGDENAIREEHEPE